MYRFSSFKTCAGPISIYFELKDLKLRVTDLLLLKVSFVENCFVRAQRFHRRLREGYLGDVQQFLVQVPVHVALL